MGSEITVGSEDLLQDFFLKGIFVQEGSSGTRYDHGQFELKPSLFTPLPNRHSTFKVIGVIGQGPETKGLLEKFFP